MLQFYHARAKTYFVTRFTLQYRYETRRFINSQSFKMVRDAKIIFCQNEPNLAFHSGESIIPLILHLMLKRDVHSLSLYK